MQPRAIDSNKPQFDVLHSTFYVLHQKYQLSPCNHFLRLKVEKKGGINIGESIQALVQ